MHNKCKPRRQRTKSVKLRRQCTTSVKYGIMHVYENFVFQHLKDNDVKMSCSVRLSLH